MWNWPQSDRESDTVIWDGFKVNVNVLMDCQQLRLISVIPGSVAEPKEQGNVCLTTEIKDVGDKKLLRT